MDQAITIHVSESLHRELMERGARLGKSVEQMAQDALMERFGSEPASQEVPMLAELRAQSLLIASLPPTQPSTYYGPDNAEQAALLDALGAEASDALNQSGRTLANVVER